MSNLTAVALTPTPRRGRPRGDRDTTFVLQLYRRSLRAVLLQHLIVSAYLLRFELSHLSLSTPM